MRQSDLDDYQSADYTDPEWLRARYHDDGMTIEEMADLADMSYSTIQKYMDRHDIERRGRGTADALRGARWETGEFDRKEWLEQKYLDEKHTIEEMAELAGVSKSTIRRRMQEHGVERRETAEAKAIRGTATKPEDQLEDYNREGWLEQKYLDEKHTIEEMAEEAGVSSSTISRNMRRQGIDTLPYPTKMATRNPGGGYYFPRDGGYETVVGPYGTDASRTIGIHRLIAVAEHGFDAVKNAVVHHKNGCKFDNRPENLEIMTKNEHRSYHSSEQMEWRERDEKGRLK